MRRHASRRRCCTRTALAPCHLLWPIQRADGAASRAHGQARYGDEYLAKDRRMSVVYSCTMLSLGVPTTRNASHIAQLLFPPSHVFLLCSFHSRVHSPLDIVLFANTTKHVGSETEACAEDALHDLHRNGACVALTQERACDYDSVRSWLARQMLTAAPSGEDRARR